MKLHALALNLESNDNQLGNFQCGRTEDESPDCSCLSRVRKAGREQVFVHEMSIAQSLIDIIREEMVKNNASNVRTVRLSVGEMSAVVPGSLEFCFSILTAKTPLERVRLIMDIVPLKGYCRVCEGIFRIENFLFVCPSCGSGQVEAIEGKDLSIVEMEVE